MEDLGDPVGEEDDDKAGDGTGDHFFTFFLGFFVGGTSEHGKATHNKHAKENKAGKGEDCWEDETNNCSNVRVAKFVAECGIVGTVINVLGMDFEGSTQYAVRSDQKKCRYFFHIRYMKPSSFMISPAMILKRATEKMMKRRPVIAPVKSSFPFLTCSALSPPVII